VVHIHLPPLRERIADIPLLIDFFLVKHNKRFKKNIRSVHSDALQIFTSYKWPGNIRELENVVERCVLFCDTETVSIEDLPPDLIGEDVNPSQPNMKDFSDLRPENGLKDQIKAATASLEKQLIHKALEQTGRNVTRAAQLLKISRKSLQTKMKEFGLRDEPGEATSNSKV
jgi:DNA-binding NtrC family response regulator